MLTASLPEWGVGRFWAAKLMVQARRMGPLGLSEIFRLCSCLPFPLPTGSLGGGGRGDKALGAGR